MRPGVIYGMKAAGVGGVLNRFHQNKIAVIFVLWFPQLSCARNSQISGHLRLKIVLRRLSRIAVVPMSCHLSQIIEITGLSYCRKTEKNTK